MTNTFTEFELFTQTDNFKLAWRRISRSTRYEVKDWLGLQIYAWQDHLDKHLERLIEKVENYSPAPAYSFFRPKGDRSLRSFNFLSIDDRLIYQAFGNSLIAQSYTDVISWANANRVFGNIPLPPDTGSDFVFKRTFTSKHRDRSRRVIGQYELFRNDILKTRAVMLEQHDSPWLIKTDIHSFYPTIRHEKLLSILSARKWQTDEKLIGLLSKCLSAWSYSEDKKGIPIGYETSDHLANLYLIQLDEKLLEFDVKRYVDDLYIFVPTFENVKRAINQADSCLAELGLHRNGGKTEILCLREVSEEGLEERLSRSLSFLADFRLSSQSEMDRQRELGYLFNENYQGNDGNDNECNNITIKDVRTVAFSLYRLDSPYPLVRDAAFHILDHYPNYSFQAIEYLTKNYYLDDEVIERLRLYVNEEYEPIKLRLDCLIGLVKRKGYHFFEQEINDTLQHPDWFMRYSVLRDVIAHNLTNLSNETISLISKLRIDSNPLVRAYAFRIAFLCDENTSYRETLINKAFQNPDTFVKVLGIQLSSEFNLQGVSKTDLPQELRKRFIDAKTHNEIEEFHTTLQLLFDIHLHPDFPIENALGDLNSYLEDLRRVFGTKEQGINDFVRAMYSLTLNFLNGVIRSQVPNHVNIDNLEELVKQHFADKKVRKDVVHLIDLWESVNNGNNLTNGLQAQLLNELRPSFQNYIRDLHYQHFGVPMRDEIFISYNRNDVDWRDKIQKHLKPHFRGKKITVWDDSHINPGQDWHQEISHALKRAKVAILLVSSDFLASDYIYDNELPPIFDASKTEGLIIVWIAVEPSAYKTTPIASIQCAHSNPDLALSERDNVDNDLVKIAAFIASLFT